MEVNCNQLNYICEKVIEKIDKKEVISEKMILDLSLFIAYMINNDVYIELPDSFNRMVEVVEGYWFYSAYNDDNTEASLSYVRVYQTINMYKVFIANNKHVERIKEASERFKRQFKLIHVIYENPGTTLKDLCRILKISSANLLKRITPLIEQGVIYISEVGKFKFYSLSNSGLDLYSLLSGEDNNTNE